MGSEKKEKEYKCRHCLFCKKDKFHVNMRVCFFGGVKAFVDPGNIACCNFSISRRATAIEKYLDRVEEGLVGNRPKKTWEPDPNVTAKEMLNRLQERMSTNVDKPKKPSVHEIKPAGAWPVPPEERTKAFNEQMCAGRCCKKKDVCKHFKSWIEHGKPRDSMRMIAAVAQCINDHDSCGAVLRYSRFIPLEGMSEDNVKEYQDTITF